MCAGVSFRTCRRDEKETRFQRRRPKRKCNPHPFGASAAPAAAAPAAPPASQPARRSQLARVQHNWMRPIRQAGACRTVSLSAAQCASDMHRLAAAMPARRMRPSLRLFACRRCQIGNRLPVVRITQLLLQARPMHPHSWSFSCNGIGFRVLAFYNVTTFCAGSCPHRLTRPRTGCAIAAADAPEAPARRWSYTRTVSSEPPTTNCQGRDGEQCTEFSSMAVLNACGAARRAG